LRRLDGPVSARADPLDPQFGGQGAITSEKRDPFPGLAVAHVGSLYQGRQLGPVLRAFRAFLNRHPRAATAGSKLRQAGEIEAPQQEAIERDLLELDLAAHVTALEESRGPRALEILARSHLALVLAGDGDLPSARQAL